jgi:hypothetical protein
MRREPAGAPQRKRSSPSAIDPTRATVPDDVEPMPGRCRQASSLPSRKRLLVWECGERRVRENRFYERH